LVENKNKIPTGTFLVENKKISQNFAIAFEKMCFGLDPDWENIPGSGSVKNESGSATLILNSAVFLVPENRSPIIKIKT